MDFAAAWFWLPVALLVLVGLFAFWYWLGKTVPRWQLEQARKDFLAHKLHLEQQFFQAASATGKPRGLRWKQCQWEEQIEWVRDKATGQLLALVGVSIAFEAIEGSDMEGLPAVGNLRNASAVFFYQDGQWQTAGRAIFNLSPEEAVRHFESGYERVMV